VDDTRDGSWRHGGVGFTLATKPSHMWVDVDEIACLLHLPTICGHQMRG
jgi:hypothetical protein